MGHSRVGRAQFATKHARLHICELPGASPTKRNLWCRWSPRGESGNLLLNPALTGHAGQFGLPESGLGAPTAARKQ